jgi:uncharacterized membrane protein
MALPWRFHVGLLLAGWGLFNVVEGLIDHHLLRIHHVRDDIAEPHWWDLGFLGFGAALTVAGLLLARSSRTLPPGWSPSKPSEEHGALGAETVAPRV